MDFQKTEDYLVLLDLDGTIADILDAKHKLCFGPSLVEIWNLYEYEDDIIEKWKQMNLYSLNRGINRYYALLKILLYVNEKYVKIYGLDEFSNWISESTDLTEENLKAKYEQTGERIFLNALEFSKLAFEKMSVIEKERLKSFEKGVEVVKNLSKDCDILAYTDLDINKAHRFLKDYEIDDCIKDVKEKREVLNTDFINKLAYLDYNRNQIILIGDGIEDYSFSKNAEILFYPILVKNENRSWSDFEQEAKKRFLICDYEGKYQQIVNKEFLRNVER